MENGLGSARLIPCNTNIKHHGLILIPHDEIRFAEAPGGVDPRLHNKIPLLFRQHVLKFPNKNIVSSNKGSMSSRANLQNVHHVLSPTRSTVVTVTSLMLLSTPSHSSSTR